ncbi:sulfatase-like hydrolase/transferase [Rubripirellula tenax]|uniref:sulfatase-like hydrolase/transferase n=1 Tax=Rubripirellula tenax TaxID=2528015 RepID=UPI001FE5CEA1|nr:sulfatase-like hydrolase/transferase [Rubripirellula tenax]
MGASQTLSDSSYANAETAKPNIVFLLTDDHRWDGYRAANNHRFKTPYLDQIAESGTRFDNAFVTLAICSPSRADCLTGRFCSVNGATAVGKTPLNEEKNNVRT